MYFAMASSLGMATLHAAEKEEEEKNAVFSESEASEDEKEHSISIKDKEYFPVVIDDEQGNHHGYFVDPDNLKNTGDDAIKDPFLKIAINDVKFRKLLTSKNTPRGEVPVYCLLQKSEAKDGKVTCDCDPSSLHEIEMQRSPHRPLPKTWMLIELEYGDGTKKEYKTKKVQMTKKKVKENLEANNDNKDTWQYEFQLDEDEDFEEIAKAEKATIHFHREDVDATGSWRCTVLCCVAACVIFIFLFVGFGLRKAGEWTV